MWIILIGQLPNIEITELPQQTKIITETMMLNRSLDLFAGLIPHSINQDSGTFKEVAVPQLGANRERAALAANTGQNFINLTF
ncbi:MAG: hypothetical protein Q8K75_00140 [Chlamydiales bacterium]|nr:hypothetical protein [Chlamydiales bacterium]